MTQTYQPWAFFQGDDAGEFCGVYHREGPAAALKAIVDICNQEVGDFQPECPAIAFDSFAGEEDRLWMEKVDGSEITVEVGGEMIRTQWDEWVLSKHPGDLYIGVFKIRQVFELV